MSLYEGISVETAPIPEIVDTVKKVDGGKYSIPWFNFFTAKIVVMLYYANPY